MESLNHYSRLRCLRGFQNSGQILNVRNKGVRKTRRVHFRCYSVCHILSKVSRRENAALASTAPGSCLTLCLCATLSILCHILLQYNSATLSNTSNTFPTLCYTLWLCATLSIPCHILLLYNPATLASHFGFVQLLWSGINSGRRDGAS